VTGRERERAESEIAREREGGGAVVHESSKMRQDNLYDLLARLFAGTTLLILIVISYHLSLRPFGHVTCNPLQRILAPVCVDHLVIGGYEQTGYHPKRCKRAFTHKQRLS